MNYEEFKIEYQNLFSAMMKYDPSMVGAGHYAEKMASLSDEYPEFAERAENEM